MPKFDPAELLALFSYHPGQPLSFVSGFFVVFLLAALLLYPFCCRNRNIRVCFLLVVSLFFYYKAGGLFVGFLILSALLDFWLGLKVCRSPRTRPALMWMWAGIAINVLLLVVFRYTPLGVRLLISLKPGIVELMVPVGISFYVFQKISYLIDVYRRKIPPATRPADFLLYVAFFPRVIAGPIVRAGEFFPQLEHPPSEKEDTTGDALYLILTGLFKKAVIADYVAISFVNRIFAAPGLYSGLENLLAVYGYALQIYCDFSGYTDMALGIARLFGIRLPQNFRSPYKSANISEFWQRWHITLSEWLRDYLFLPIANGLSRRIEADRLLGLKTEFWLYGSSAILTWLICGLWHGAAWGFVIWGLIHGTALTLEKIFRIPQKTRKAGPWRFWGHIFSFHVICLSWIFFRADTLETARLVLEQIFLHFQARLFPQIIQGYPLVVCLMGLGFLLHYFPDKAKGRLQSAMAAMPLVLQSLILAVMIWIVLQMQSADIQPFIYFQF
jgi:alginate O-acetyltransferase complex protein AlgI